MRAIDRIYARAWSPDQIAEWRAQTGELDAETCGALLAEDFTRADPATGKQVPVTVNMGVLEEPHHAGCYRLYNLWREAQVHDYHPTTPPRRPLAPLARPPRPRRHPLRPIPLTPWPDLRAHAAAWAQASSLRRRVHLA